MPMDSKMATITNDGTASAQYLKESKPAISYSKRQPSKLSSFLSHKYNIQAAVLLMSRINEIQVPFDLIGTATIQCITVYPSAPDDIDFIQSEQGPKTEGKDMDSKGAMGRREVYHTC